MKIPTKKKLFHLIALVFSFYAFCLPVGMATAGSEYRCSNHSNHDLVFHTDQHGNILYQFTGDLTCWYHQEVSTADSIFTLGIVHDTDKRQTYGHYRVTAQVGGKAVQEKISYQMAGDTEASINTKYTCAHDPFTTKNPACVLRTQSNEPYPSTYGGAIQKAAYNSVPLSIGLYLGALPANLSNASTPPAQQDHSPPQQEDLAGPSAKSLVTDIVYTKNSFIKDRREYFFNFTTQQGCYQLGSDTAANDHNPCSRTEKLEALATKYIDGQRVDISIRGGAHHIDLQYKCANIMDPFLDPSNACTLTNIPTSFNDSLYRDLVQKKYDMVYLFSHAIRNGRRTSMIWKALASSMHPEIFEGGKKAAPEGAKITFSSDADIVLKVESARDIKRSGEQAVLFHIKPDYGSRVSDTEGNIIAMPLTSKYTGNSYNGAVRTVKHLAPGKYTFFTAMMTSLSDMEKSKKIPFEVISHVSPKQAPVIGSPQENEKIEKDSSVSFKILVSRPMFGTGFDAKIHCEHSRLAAQTPYKPIDDFSIKNDGQKSMLQIWHSFGDGKQSTTGDFRCRARMVYDGKERGEWSGWRHFHIGGKAMPHMHAGFAILSPREDQIYEGKIPVKISLPKNITKDTQLSLFWEAVSGEHAGNTLATHTVVVQPGETYETAQDTAQFTTWMQGSDGRIKLVASLDKGHTAKVIFSIPTLGKPAQKEEKKSGSFSLDTPIFATPDDGQIFMAPATVKMKILHAKEERIFTRLQYSPFSTDKMAILHYQDSSLKPVATDTKEGTTTVTYRIDKPGFWRVQATTTGQLAFDSAWRAFKVDTLNNTAAKSVKLGIPQGITKPNTPVFIPKKSFIPTKNISAVQGNKAKPVDKLAQKSINPQPEPPGKTMRSVAKLIEFSGLKRFYHAPATVRIGLKNANLRTMEFELRYKQSRGNGFKKMTRVAQKILRRQGQFTLQLSLTDPGYYQIRFRSKKGAPWSRRTNFQVTGDLSKMAARVQRLHKAQVANVGTIIPRVGSEPAASAKPAGSTAQVVRSSMGTKKISSTLQLAKKNLEPAKIRAPHNGQKFMMNGSSYMLHGEVQHAAGQQLEFDLRLHQGGKNTRLHPAIRQRKSSRQTKIVIALRETGDYSLRVKYKGAGSRWSGWTNFTLGRIMKKIPKLQQKKSQIKSISKKTIVPQMQITPQVERIR